jgi:CubicO group peptidase (beta-lactamase class C family)
MKYFFYLVSLVISWFGTANAQNNPLKHIADSLEIPGMQVVHVKNGKLANFEYGKKKSDSTALINSTTIFQAASLTKVVTAYTFFKLYAQGLIDLDKPLPTYFNYDRIENDPNKDLITARLVLTHRTGLLNWEGPVGAAAWYTTPLNTQFKPGTQYKYSGEGFYYLQKAMEEITGKPFAKLVDEEVFKPLGMKNSAMQWKAEFENFSFGHYAGEKVRRLAKWSYTNAAYTMYTTATDYSLFVQKALLLGEGLSRKNHRLMITKANVVQKEVGVHHDDDKYVPTALGMRLQLNETGTWLWHTGSNPGFRCFFIANLRTKESLVAFSNADTGMPAFNSLMKTFLGKNQTFWAYSWRLGELD